MKALYLCDDCQWEETSKLCLAHGYGIEIQSFYDPSFESANPSAIQLHRQAIEGIPMRSLHGPFGDLCAGSFDPMIRNVTRIRYDSAVRVAKSLGISQIVLHHGYVPGTTPPDMWVKRYAKFWHELLSSTPLTCQYYLENHLEQSPLLVAEVLSQINDPRVQVCLDIGHAYIYSDKGAMEWITSLKDRIGYIHLHDNHGAKDEHLGLGDGTIPLEAVLSVLEESAPNTVWALESKPERFGSSLDWLTKHRFL